MSGFRTISPVAMTQAAPPGLEAVPVSCYSGSFRIWSSENDIVAEREQLEADDESIFEHDSASEDGASKTEHFFIDQPPEISKRNGGNIIPEERTFVDCAV